MQRFLLKIIFTLAALTLAACNNLAVWLPTNANLEAFTITSSANLVQKDAYLLEWKPLAKSKNYTVTIASDTACSNIIFEKKVARETQLWLNSLAEGEYHLCVFAQVDGRSHAASNNGISLVIDLTPPAVISQTEVEAHSQAFVFDQGLKDLTMVSALWSQETGKGQVSFEPSDSITPKVSASSPGLYRIKAVFTDQAGNSSSYSY